MKTILLSLLACLLPSMAFAQATQPVGSGINITKVSAVGSPPGPAGTDRYWAATGNLPEFTTVAGVTSQLAFFGSVNGLEGPYSSATSAAQNIIAESLALGPVIVRAPVSPSGPQFAIEDSTGATTYFGVSTTTISLGAITKIEIPGIGTSEGTLDIAGDAPANGYISGDNMATGGTEGTGTLLLASNHSNTASLFFLDDTLGSAWDNLVGANIDVGLNSTNGRFLVTNFSPDTQAPAIRFNTATAWGAGIVTVQYENNGVQKNEWFGDGSELAQGPLTVNDTTQGFGLDIAHGAGQELKVIVGTVGVTEAQIGSGFFAWATNSDGNVTTPSNERMRLLSNGHFLVNQTAESFSDNIQIYGSEYVQTNERIDGGLTIGGAAQTNYSLYTYNTGTQEGNGHFEGFLNVGTIVGATTSNPFFVHGATNDNFGVRGDGSAIQLFAGEDTGASFSPMEIEATTITLGLQSHGNVIIANALEFPETGVAGFGPKLGQATWVGGTVTVTNTRVTNAHSRIFCNAIGAPNAIGDCTPGTIVDNTSFVLASGDPSDTRTVNWFILEAE